MLRRKLDYLAGVVPRPEIPEDKNFGQTDDSRLTEGVGGLCLKGSKIQPGYKKNKKDENSAKSSMEHRKNLYHYERYPPTGRQV